MPTIQVLRPNVTREEAVQQFSRGFSGWLRRTTLGPLRLLADVYIPFYVIQVDIADRHRTQTRVLGIDAIIGSLDLYEFDSGKSTPIQTNNFLEPRITPDRAAQLCIEKTRRILFNRGFFRMQQPRITPSYASKTWWVPYWVGFHGENSTVSLSVIDAVRRRFEGAKVRTLLKDWLQEAHPVAAQDHGQRLSDQETAAAR